MKKLIFTLLVIAITKTTFAQTVNRDVQSLFGKCEKKAISSLKKKCTSEFEVSSTTLGEGSIKYQYAANNYFDELIAGKRYDSLAFATREGNLPNTQIHTVRCYDSNNTEVRYIHFVFEKAMETWLLIAVLDSSL